jgi:hypothetical protein
MPGIILGGKAADQPGTLLFYCVYCAVDI